MEYSGGKVGRCPCKAEQRFHSLCVTAANAQTVLPAFCHRLQLSRAVQELPEDARWAGVSAGSCRLPDPGQP